MTLYERIGGATAVSEMVDAFFGRVLADPELRPFFKNSTVERLQRMQAAFFAAALEGPDGVGNFDIAKIHKGLKIRREHLTRFVDHLISVLDDRHSISRRDAMDVIFRIATYSDQVLGESGGTDG